MRTITLEKGLATFLDGLAGKNRSAATLRAYRTDVLQFITFLHENNVGVICPKPQKGIFHGTYIF